MLIGGEDALDDHLGFRLACPAQAYAALRHRSVDNKLEHIVGMLALAQQARDNARLRRIGAGAVVHAGEFGLDIDRPFVLADAGMRLAGRLRLACQQRLGQQVVELLELGDIERPAAVPKRMAKPVAAVLLVVRADTADQCRRVHGCRIGRQFFRQAFPHRHHARVLRRVAQWRVLDLYADMKIAEAAVAYPNKFYRQAAQPFDDVVAAGLDVLQVEVEINVLQPRHRLQAAPSCARQQLIDALENAAVRPLVFGLDEPLGQGQVVGKQFLRLARLSGLRQTANIVGHGGSLCRKDSRHWRRLLGYSSFRVKNVTLLFLPVSALARAHGRFLCAGIRRICVAANEAGLRHDFFRPAIAHTEPLAMAGITIVRRAR